MKITRIPVPIRLLGCVCALFLLAAACGDDTDDEPAAPGVTDGESVEANETGENDDETEVETPTVEPAVPPSIDDGIDAAVFTDDYGCGFGFQTGNADQTLGVFVTFNEFDAANAGQVPPVGNVPSVIWSGEIRVGTDLFANWCNDIVDEDTPVAEVSEVWEIVDAQVTIIGDPPVQEVGELTIQLDNLVAEAPDGRTTTIESITIVNEIWGAFAG